MKLFNDNSWRESRSNLGFVMMTTLRIDEFVYSNQTRRNITSLTIIKVSKDNIFRYTVP